MPTGTETDFARAAELFHALSDQARVEIVSVLLGGEQCVCDLMDVVGAAQSRLSYHLKVLKDAGLVVQKPIRLRTVPGAAEVIALKPPA